MEQETRQLTFVRRPSKLGMSKGVGRYCFTIPLSVSRLLSNHQNYEVTIRPVGTLVIKND